MSKWSKRLALFLILIFIFENVLISGVYAFSDNSVGMNVSMPQLSLTTPSNLAATNSTDAAANLSLDTIDNYSSTMSATTYISNFVAGASGDVLSLTTTNNSGSGPFYCYYKFSNTQYTFQAGDYIEYDVKQLNNIDGAGGIECITTDGSYLRDLPGWFDQNNISGHPAANLSSRAYGVWYHRRLPVPSSVIGKTVDHWDIVGSSQTSGASYTGLYDNIVVADSSGNEKKSIFKSKKDSNLNSIDWSRDASSVMRITDVNGNLLSNPLGDILSLTTTNNTGSGPFYCYYKFSNSQYTFQAGDYIEYDVKQFNNIDGAGGIECITTDGSYLRNLPGWFDQNNISGHPAANLSSRAYGVWYHRRLPVPSSAIGKTADHWDIVGSSQTSGANYTSLYDNILIVDSSGNEKKSIFKSKKDSNLNSIDWSRDASSVMRITDVNGNLLPNPLGDILSLTTTNNTGSGPFYCYYKFSNSQYTFQAGDYIEYDVKQFNNIDGAGGIECITTDGSYLRDLPGWFDQNNISGHPAANLSSRAYGVWYHRRLPVPSSAIGKTADHWDVVGSSQTSGARYTSLYDNIVVTNGSGMEKKVIFKSQGDANINITDFSYEASSVMRYDFNDDDYEKTYEYDSCGRLYQINENGVPVLRYEYDNNGNIIRKIKL